MRAPYTLSAADVNAIRILESHERSLYLPDAPAAEQHACTIVLEKFRRWVTSDRSTPPPTFVMRALEAPQRPAEAPEASTPAPPARRPAKAPRRPLQPIVITVGGVSLTFDAALDPDLRDRAIEDIQQFARWSILAGVAERDSAMARAAASELGIVADSLRRAGVLRDGLPLREFPKSVK